MRKASVLKEVYHLLGGPVFQGRSHFLPQRHKVRSPSIKLDQVGQLWHFYLFKTVELTLILRMLNQEKLPCLQESCLVLNRLDFCDCACFGGDHSNWFSHTDHLLLLWFFWVIGYEAVDTDLPYFNLRLCLDCKTKPSERCWDATTVLEIDFCSQHLETGRLWIGLRLEDTLESQHPHFIHRCQCKCQISRTLNLNRMHAGI